MRAIIMQSPNNRRAHGASKIIHSSRINVALTDAGVKIDPRDSPLRVPVCVCVCACVYVVVQSNVII